MTIDTSDIRAEAHPHIGSLIERDAVTLVERWCERALDEQPVARQVPPEALRDHLVAFLGNVGRLLQKRGHEDPDEHRDDAAEHGEQRWDMGWSLREVVGDYQLLRLVILEHLEEQLDRPLSYREALAIHVFIDDAVAESAASYSLNREEHARRLERGRAEALREANRRKDEFLATLGHELRNPLAPIRNALKVAQTLLAGFATEGGRSTAAGAVDPRVVDAVAIAERQTRLLARLVDDLLDIARVELGQLALRRAPVDLAAAVRDAVEGVASELAGREQQLTVALPAEPLLVDADPARLQQVVTNLLANAAKYTGRGGEIRLVAAAEGGNALLRVSDTGIGIPADMLSSVFDMFVQSEESRRYAPGGLGIGLALVRKIIELHGGTVTASSNGPGAGSEFLVQLPRSPMAVSEPPATGGLAGSAGRHLLIVEDQADARDSLATLLRLQGHRVEVAEDAARGIAAALASPPEFVLVDIGLPDADGYAVARELRARLGNAVMLVALTGYGQPEDLRRAIDAGFDAHLLKPPDLDALAQLLAGSRTKPG